MTPERWQQIDRLFHEALAQPREGRMAFLINACAGDEALRLEVESLISSHESHESFIETPAADVAAELLGAHKSRLQPKHLIINYRIVCELGSGGMGEVYLADDIRLHRKIALKLLPSSYTNDPDRVRRFGQEARAASALNHPNIVTIHEIGETDSLHFIATEFIDGETLRQHMRKTRMNVAEVLDVTIQLASALEAAHEAGIVHRDIKPENIMLRHDGIVKVLDFGLAKLAHRTASPPRAADATADTNPGMIVGTVNYMSPEQARGREVDQRTDIWSLGVVLYEMIAGQTPFQGETPSHVIVSILETQPCSLHSDPELPPGLNRIVLKAMSKDKNGRYQTAEEMGRDLKTLKEELNAEALIKKFGGLTTVGEVQATTNEAIRRTTSLHETTTTTATAQYLITGIRQHRRGIAFTSIVAILSVVTILYFLKTSSSRSNATPGRTIDSVAVLRFFSNDSNTDYLSVGLKENISNGLSRLPNLKVISAQLQPVNGTETVNVSDVGHNLQVNAVLIGTMTQNGDTLGVTAELWYVPDNRRLWLHEYKGSVKQISRIQDEITQHVSSQLRGGDSQVRSESRNTTSTEAYDAYLRGRFLLEKRTPQATERSVEYFQDAIKRDPNYAPAYASLGYAYWSRVGATHASEEMAKAKAVVAKALEIDSTLAEAHTVLALIRSSDLDWVGTESAHSRAIQLNPNSAFAHTNYAFYLMFMKRFDEAVAEAQRAVELEPTSVLYNRNLAMQLYVARRYDEAIVQCNKTLELDTNMVTMYWWLGEIYEQKGLLDQAFAAHLHHEELKGTDAAALKEAHTSLGRKGFWKKLLDLTKKEAANRTVDPYKFAEIYVRLGEKDKVFYWLERTLGERNNLFAFVATDPEWDSLRSDSRYIDLVKRIGLQP